MKKIKIEIPKNNKERIMNGKNQLFVILHIIFRVLGLWNPYYEKLSTTTTYEIGKDKSNYPCYKSKSLYSRTIGHNKIQKKNNESCVKLLT